MEGPLLGDAHLGVEVSAHSFLSPWLEVELSSALLFRIPNNISHCLESTKDRTVQGVQKLWLC